MKVTIEIGVFDSEAIEGMQKELIKPMFKNYLAGQIAGVVHNAIADLCQKFDTAAVVNVIPEGGPPLVYYESEPEQWLEQKVMEEAELQAADSEPVPSHSGPFFPCPVCGQEMDHYRNVDRNHYGVCLNCQGYFWVGSNLFSSWKEETQEEWDKNAAYLGQLRKLDSDEVSF